MKKFCLRVTLTITLVLAVFSVLLMPVPIQVFALEIQTPPIPQLPHFLIGNMTLQLENFTYSMEFNNETYSLQIGLADVRIQSEKYGDTTETIVDIEVQNCRVTGSMSLWFNYLELHMVINMYQEADGYTTVEAVTYEPLWKYLQTLVMR